MDSEDKIPVLNAASLVELKAEIYKKKLEARKRGFHSSLNVTHKRSKTLEKIMLNTKKKFEGTHKKPTVDISGLDEQETQKLKEVSRCLEVKSKLYDKLKKDAKDGKIPITSSSSDIMVDFSRKADTDSHDIESSFHDMVQHAEAEHREKMNLKWQEEKQRLAEKPLGQEHYQDVFFDELREHGVGYFHFSSNENERQQQMELLNKLHNEAAISRQKNQEIKERRERNIKKRLMNIKLRKGLPIEEEVVEAPPQVPEEDEPADYMFDQEIDELIEESKKKIIEDKILKKVHETEQHNTPTDNDSNFAPPVDYSIKNRQKKYNSRY